MIDGVFIKLPMHSYQICCCRRDQRVKCNPTIAVMHETINVYDKFLPTIAKDTLYFAVSFYSVRHITNLDKICVLCPFLVKTFDWTIKESYS